jgi:hypothetical protein
MRPENYWLPSTPGLPRALEAGQGLCLTSLREEGLLVASQLGGQFMGHFSDLTVPA